MKKILIILTGVLLVYSEPVLANNELTGIAIARKISKSVKKTSQKKKKKKIVQKKKKVFSKNKKKVVSKKKIQKKRRKVVRRTYVRFDRIEIQGYAYGLVKSYGWSDYDFDCLVKLWYRESSWNPNAINPKSGACGLAQANPCSKASKGTDYRTNWRTQVRWGLNYIKKRYGSPTNAWKHSQRTGWY